MDKEDAESQKRTPKRTKETNHTTNLTNLLCLVFACCRRKARPRTHKGGGTHTVLGPAGPQSDVPLRYQCEPYDLRWQCLSNETVRQHDKVNDRSKPTLPPEIKSTKTVNKIGSTKTQNNTTHAKVDIDFNQTGAFSDRAEHANLAANEHPIQSGSNSANFNDTA